MDIVPFNIPFTIPQVDSFDQNLPDFAYSPFGEAQADVVEFGDVLQSEFQCDGDCQVLSDHQSVEPFDRLRLPRNLGS